MGPAGVFSKGSVWLVAAALGCAGCAPAGKANTERAGAERIVVLAPAAAEMLEALGLLDRVVAVGEFGPWPAALDGLPRAGGYAAPSIERVLELRAGWVVTARSEAAAEAHARLEAAGVRVLALDTSTFDGVFRALLELGTTFDKPAEAGAIAARLRDDLLAVERRAAGLPRRRVLFVVGRDPLFVAGPGSHIDRLIEIVGGENVAADAFGPYARISVESVLERKPEVIVDTSDNRPGALRGRDAGSWGRWPFLPAVRERRVYHVDPGRLAIPGLRLAEMALTLGRLVHPETFGEPVETDFSAPDRRSTTP